MGIAHPGLLVALVGLVTIALSSYALGIFLTAVVIHLPSARSLALNLTLAIMSAICGVNFGIEMLPSPIATLARLLPLTNGLSAVRSLFDGDPAGTIAGWAAAEVAVAAGWLAFAVVVFQMVIERDRRRGAIDFG